MYIFFCIDNEIIIRAYAEGYQDEEDEIKKQRYAEIIISETERMNNLITTLLDLSALETILFAACSNLAIGLEIKQLIKKSTVKINSTTKTVQIGSEIFGENGNLVESIYEIMRTAPITLDAKSIFFRIE